MDTRTDEELASELEEIDTIADFQIRFSGNGNIYEVDISNARKRIKEYFGKTNLRETAKEFFATPYDFNKLNNSTIIMDNGDFVFAFFVTVKKNNLLVLGTTIVAEFGGFIMRFNETGNALDLGSCSYSEKELPDLARLVDEGLKFLSLKEKRQ